MVIDSIYIVSEGKKFKGNNIPEFTVEKDSNGYAIMFCGSELFRLDELQTAEWTKERISQEVSNTLREVKEIKESQEAIVKENQALRMLLQNTLDAVDAMEGRRSDIGKSDCEKSIESAKEFIRK